MSEAASLWATTAPPAPETPPLDTPATADVCVVGAGFTGLSAALHLAEAGRSVVCVDSGGPGHGASGRNGGQVLAGLKWSPDDLARRFGPERGARIAAFAGDAPGVVYDLIERHRIDCGLRRCGWLNAAVDAAALHRQRAVVAQWAARGAPVRLAGRDETAALLGTGRYAGAMLDDRAGALNPLAYARGLAAAALRAGARVHGGSAALRLTQTGDGWRVETARASVTVGQVLLATNGYTDGLWPGLAQSIVPVHSLQVATAPLPDHVRAGVLPGGHVVSDTQRILLYFRLSPEGRLVMGARGSFGATNPDALYRFVREAAVRLYPGVSGARWDFAWAGRVALTVDHLPRVHRLAPGLVACLGYNGRGVAMATASGRAVARWLVTGDDGALPLPFAPLRPLPLHGLRRPVLELRAAWARLRDRMAGGFGSA